MPRRRNVTEGNLVITEDTGGCDPAFVQHFIEEKSTAGTLLPIHQLDVLPRKIGNFLDFLRISLCDDQPLFPLSEGDDLVPAVWKQFLHDRYI